MELKPVTANEIPERYSKGERDFSNSLLNVLNLSRTNLRGIIFKNCWVKGVSFHHSDLINANFEGSLIDNFGSFRAANLTRVSFRNAKLQFIYAEGATLDHTDFSNADLLWVGFMNCNRGGADFTGAKITHVIWSFDEVDVEKALEIALPHIMKSDLPESRKLLIKAFVPVILGQVKGFAKPSYETRVMAEKMFDVLYSPPKISGNVDQYGEGGSGYSEKMEYGESPSEKKKGKTYNK